MSIPQGAMRQAHEQLRQVRTTAGKVLDVDAGLCQIIQQQRECSGRRQVEAQGLRCIAHHLWENRHDPSDPRCR